MTNNPLPAISQERTVTTYLYGKTEVTVVTTRLNKPGQKALEDLQKALANWVLSTQEGGNENGQQSAAVQPE